MKTKKDAKNNQVKDIYPEKNGLSTREAISLCSANNLSITRPGLIYQIKKYRLGKKSLKGYLINKGLLLQLLQSRMDVLNGNT